MNPQAEINGQMVALAREYRGITQTGLAAACGVTQQAVARLEAGVATALGQDRLKKVAQELSFPAEFFALSESRLGFGSSSYFYRKKITTASERNRISGIVNITRVHLALMLRFVEIGTSLPLPRCSVQDGYTPQHAANLLRTAWNLPDGPIPNLTNLVEKAGIVVIECPFGTRSIDGTSLWINSLPPIIFVNDALPPDRFRFTVAHELGHLIMHHIPAENMEDEANSFASELLMQELSFKVNVSQICHGRPTIGKLLQLKPYWKVAVSAMIMRLYEIGRIRDSDKRSLFIMLANQKMISEEPQPFEKERPRLLKAILDAAFHGYTSKAEAAREILLIFESDLKYLYGALLASEKSLFRIVS